MFGDDNVFDMDTLTDGNPDTCITMSPTQSGGAILGNFTVDASKKISLQIITENTNASSCSDLNLVYALKPSECENGGIINPCILRKDCLRKGFCDYRCGCVERVCHVYLVDIRRQLNSEWQLCDILV